MEAAAVKTKWTLDSTHSELMFKVKHLMITNVNGDDITKADLNVTVDAASISTNDDHRDVHLKSADFFDVENHKEITFHGTSFESMDESTYLLKGMLTMKGISKEITLDVEFGGVSKDPWGNEKAGFSINGKINRKDWGLNWNAALETGGVMVSEEVKISGEVQFVKS
jgi:polyisoprenoid-binding protein YceI